jgi:hypothetical protein
MKLLISTSIFSVFAMSAFAGVMPEDIQATTNVIANTVEVASGAEVISEQPQLTFKEQLDELIQFAFTAFFILL